jgi:hypothetical protein
VVGAGWQARVSDQRRRVRHRHVGHRGQRHRWSRRGDLVDRRIPEPRGSSGASHAGRGEPGPATARVHRDVRQRGSDRLPRGSVPDPCASPERAGSAGHVVRSAVRETADHHITPRAFDPIVEVELDLPYPITDPDRVYWMEASKGNGDQGGITGPFGFGRPDTPRNSSAPHPNTSGASSSWIAGSLRLHGRKNLVPASCAGCACGRRSSRPKIRRPGNAST